MKREEMLKKLIQESQDLEEQKKLQEQIRRDNAQYDDHGGAILGTRSVPPGEDNEKE